MKTIEKFKRYTLFPNNSQPLNSDRMLEFISPMMGLGYLPKVNKGYAINVGQNGEGMKPVEAWSVDFVSHNSNGISISLTQERIDIKCQAEDMDWNRFADISKPIVDIMLRLTENGFSRIAIGNVVTKEADRADAVENGWFYDADLSKPNLRERIDQEVLSMMFKNKGDDTMPYNFVTTRTLSIIEPKYQYKIDCDINTLIGVPNEIVTRNMEAFFDMMVHELSMSPD